MKLVAGTTFRSFENDRQLNHQIMQQRDTKKLSYRTLNEKIRQHL